MRRAWLSVGLLFLLALPTSGAGVTARTATMNGVETVTLANRFCELTFEPARGGRCTSFRFLDNGEQLIGKGADCGMFLDHWSKYTWPSSLIRLPYHYEILKQENRVGLKQWVTVPAIGGGKGDGATSPELVGLVLNKTVWLRDGTDCIEVEHEITNPTKESRGVGLYVQHNFNLNGDLYNDIWYLPSSQGVVYDILPTKPGGKSYGTDWVLDPTAGWMGVRDQKTKRGLIFAFDYNYLQRLYTCGSTAEWFLETVPVAPGKSFKTTHVIKPVYGFQDFVYASKSLVADIRATEKGKSVDVAVDLAAVNRPLRGITLEVTATGWRSKEKLATQTFAVDQLGYEKLRKTFRFTAKGVTDGVVIRATLKGADLAETFEYYYAGDKFEHERRYGYFATKGGALAGAKGDSYFVKPPRKAKQFDKPDFSKVARPAKDHFKCLVIFGLYTDLLNLDDALAGWKSKAGRPVEFTWVNCPPNAVEAFPGSYDELFRYNVVVLSDVNFKAIGDIGFEMLCDYVEHGGKLVVTGGPYALGNGEFEGARFREVLPAELTGPFDLKWAGKGQSWLLQPARETDPLLHGVSFAENPRVFWHHFVTPKKGADVVLQADGRPCLLQGRYGQGKVILATLSPTGKAATGEVAWWSWNGWPVLLQNAFTWLDE